MLIIYQSPWHPYLTPISLSNRSNSGRMNVQENPSTARPHCHNWHSIFIPILSKCCCYATYTIMPTWGEIRHNVVSSVFCISYYWPAPVNEPKLDRFAVNNDIIVGPPQFTRARYSLRFKLLNTLLLFHLSHRQSRCFFSYMLVLFG